MKKSSNFSPIIVLFLLWSSNAKSQTQVVPEVATVQNASYAGSVCPQGSLGVSITADRSNLKIFTNGIVLETGPGIPVSETRKNCQMSLDIRHTPGWSYAFSGLRGTMFAQLKAGQQYLFEMKTYTAALSYIIARLSLSGPLSGDFLLQDYAVAGSQSGLNWSPCALRRATNIALSARIYSPRSFAHQGHVEIPNVSLESEHFFVPILWRRCS